MSEHSTTRVVIPVEIKSRELYAKLFLAMILAEKDYEVYLGNKIQHTALGRINPDVYFESGAVQQASRLQRCKQNGVKTIILETEGAAFSGKEDFSELVDAETLEYTDCYCAWGEVAKQVVKSEASNTRVEVTGNPRFDLLQQPYRKIYNETAGRLKNRYGNFILFNSNFTLSNGEKTVKRKSKNWDKQDPVWKRLMRTLRKESKIFPEMLRLISDTADKFENKNVIIRPHPSESKSFYQDIFYSHDNIHVEKQGEVRPWIKAADVVIHNSCTTGVTSVLLNTPTVAYVPDGMEILSLPNRVSDCCKTKSEVFERIDHHLQYKSMTLTNEKEKLIKEHIDNTDYLSSIRIGEVLDSVMENKSPSSLKEHKKLRLRQFCVRMLGSRRFERLWIERIQDEDRHKHPYTTTEEVKSLINQFSDEIKPVGLQVSRLPYMVNGFRISCE